ncbi:MAG: serine hydrolase [Herpetosiphon sp.]
MPPDLRPMLAWLPQQPGDWSVWVGPPGGTPWLAYHAEIVRSAASLIKLAIALSMDNDVASGKLDLEQTVSLQEASRVEGDGLVDLAPAGSVWSYRDLIDHMLHESDNTAANLLIDLLDEQGLGMAAVNSYLQTLGASQTRLQRRMLDYAARAAGRDNLTTAADMARLFTALLRSERPLPRHWLQLLHDAWYPDKVVAGVPQGIAVAHKPGDLPGVEHDVGVVYLPDRPYLVALLVVDLPTDRPVRPLLAEASRRIYHCIAGGTIYAA